MIIKSFFLILFKKQGEKLHWDPEYIPTHVNKALIDTAVTADFGYKGNTHVVRSTYKVRFLYINYYFHP